MSYFDGATLARRGNVSMLFSVGLKDHICPPSTVYAAYNHCGAQRNVDQADKQIRVCPFNDHEGGGPAREVVNRNGRPSGWKPRCDSIERRWVRIMSQLTCPSAGLGIHGI